MAQSLRRTAALKPQVTPTDEDGRMRGGYAQVERVKKREERDRDDLRDPDNGESAGEG